MELRTHSLRSLHVGSKKWRDLRKLFTNKVPVIFVCKLFVSPTKHFGTVGSLCPFVCLVVCMYVIPYIIIPLSNLYASDKNCPRAKALRQYFLVWDLQSDLFPHADLITIYYYRCRRRHMYSLIFQLLLGAFRTNHCKKGHSAIKWICSKCKFPSVSALR